MTGALGLMLGLAYVASPGPVNVETLRRGLAGGVRVALTLQLGAIIGHLIWALLALAGVGLLLASALAQLLLGAAGTVLLVYLGWSALRGWQKLAAAAQAEREAGPATQAVRSRRRIFLTCVAIAIANPFGPAFWLSIGGTLEPGVYGGAATFLGGFFLGSLLAALSIALLVGIGHTRITPRLVRLASHCCGLLLIGFGALVGYTTVLG